MKLVAVLRNLTERKSNFLRLGPSGNVINVSDVPQNKVQCRECDKTVWRDRLERHMRLNHYLPHNHSRYKHDQ